MFNVINIITNICTQNVHQLANCGQILQPIVRDETILKNTIVVHCSRIMNEIGCATLIITQQT